MILSVFKFYCYHSCSYKLCNPVLDYYQMIFNFPFFYVNIQTDLHVYNIYITQHVSIFKDSMVHWHMDSHEKGTGSIAIVAKGYLSVLNIYILCPEFLIIYIWNYPKQLLFEFCLEMFYIHIWCFSLLTLLGEHQRRNEI